MPGKTRPCSPEEKELKLWSEKEPPQPEVSQSHSSFRNEGFTDLGKFRDLGIGVSSKTCKEQLVRIWPERKPLDGHLGPQLLFIPISGSTFPCCSLYCAGSSQTLKIPQENDSQAGKHQHSSTSSPRRAQPFPQHLIPIPGIFPNVSKLLCTTEPQLIPPQECVSQLFQLI